MLVDFISPMDGHLVIYISFDVSMFFFFVFLNGSTNSLYFFIYCL